MKNYLLKFNKILFTFIAVFSVVAVLFSGFCGNTLQSIFQSAHAETNILQNDTDHKISRLYSNSDNFKNEISNDYVEFNNIQLCLDESIKLIKDECCYDSVHEHKSLQAIVTNQKDFAWENYILVVNNVDLIFQKDINKNFLGFSQNYIKDYSPPNSILRC